MEKIRAALRRANEAAAERRHSVTVFSDGSGHIEDPRGKEIASFGPDSSDAHIAAIIDNYVESLKPKPRPIPEIVKDLRVYFKDRIISVELDKLLDELSNSPAATFPF